MTAAPASPAIAAVRPRDGLAWRTDGRVEAISRATPAETAIGLSFDGRPHTVLMATPGDYEDLAVGFTVSEAIARFEEITGVDVSAVEDGVLVDVTLAADAPRKRGRPRGLEGRSSCGLCGVQRLADALRPLPQVESSLVVTPQAVQRAVAETGARQILGRETRATHAAGFATPDGAVVAVREDVGRHNALDKLGGALLRAGVNPGDGFIVVTSRCSFEMVEKTARFGAPMIVAISAPTELAIRRAELAGVTLAALARDDGHAVFSHPQRLGLGRWSMAKAPKIPGIHKYDMPAGGWGALKAVGGALADQDTVIEGGRTLLHANQPEGFDCPGCAWPDPKHTSSFEFCENGAKAVAWEATSRRATPDLFARHTLTELRTWTDHALEDTGRLTHPLAYDAESDRYLAIEWNDAFARIAAALKAMDHPNQAEFYASGRCSNEAAFLYQLLGRRVGTNNFPDCSNMCHEPTSVGLPEAIGLGKGSVSLEDFDHADLILSFGHNPGTNHPRMMATLREAARRGCRILVFNPLKERALERFASPQDPVEMATLSSTPIASDYFQVAVGGDVALVQGMMKALLAWDAAEGGVLDHAFITEHTSGLDALKAQLDALDWPELEARSALTRAEIERAARAYAQARNVILCYGMGLTQHIDSTSAVQQLVNLLLLRGNLGRPGAGICPLRGHSNVQGNRSVGIWEKPSEAFLAGLDRATGIVSPRAHGHTVVETIAAMERDEVRFFMGLGGNFAVAAPDPARTHAAMRRVGLTVHVATKLNRTHLLPGAASLLLPCLGRTEIDVQAGGRQAVTVEDSMSMVHASKGLNPPASPELRSEVAIVAGVGRALFGPGDPVDWDALTAEYDRIRDLIEATQPEQFTDYNARIRIPGGFRLPAPSAEREWKTPDKRARFLPYRASIADLRRGDPDVLLLTTIRSHDQYNTTIYGQNDRYRGVFGRRDVVFAPPDELARRGLAPGDRVDLVPAFDTDPARIVRGFTVVARDLPVGCAAAYYPETNALVMLDDHDARSGTPAYKSIPVRLRAAETLA